MMVAARLRRKQEDHPTTSATVSISSNSTSRHRGADGVVRSVRMVILIAEGSDWLQAAAAVFLMRSTTSMMLAPGWRWMLTMTAGVVVHPRGLLHVLRAVDHVATSDSRTGAPLR
jgi:hypothetical protein